MSEQTERPIPLMRVRRQGQRMTKQERKVAQDKFIHALENTANARAACMSAGIHASTVYQWAEHDAEFSVRFNEANKNANWLLFGEAWKRAMIGEERYYVSRGELVLGPDGKPQVYHEKSDRLLELLLKARLPEFREKQQVEMSGSIDINGSKEQLLTKLSNMIRTVDATSEESTTQ